MTEPIRVVIADDDEQIRAQVRKLLQGQTHLQVVAEAATGQEAMTLVKRHLPQLLLLDIEMPGMNGLQALQRIRHDHPRTHVVIVSGQTDRTSVRTAQELGAQGYVAKRDLTDELILAIGAVIAGGSFLSHAVNKEKPMSTTRARETSAANTREAKMTNDQCRDTAGLVVSTLSGEQDQDNAASRETELIRVLVVDDESLVVKVLRDILTRDSRIHLAGSCEDVDTAVQLIRQQSPDIVLLDLGLPSSESVRSLERGGWYVVDKLRQADSRVRVILCTRARKRKDVTEAWRKEIEGYVPKTVVDEELVQAICTVHSGQRYFSGSLGKFGLKCRGALTKLTDTEQKVFFLFVRGLPTNEILEELCMGDKTFHTHMNHIRQKIGHQYGWKGIASEVRKEGKARKAQETGEGNDTLKYSELLSGLNEMERKVFDQYVGRWHHRGYVGGKTAPEDIAEALCIPVGEVKDLIGEVRYKLSPHQSDGWKGIARDEGDID